jgi:cytochrome P450
VTSAGQRVDLNPVSLENLLNPAPFYRVLRETEPIYWSDAVRGWLISRYEDVLGCFRDSRVSSDRTGFFEVQLQGFGMEAAEGFLNTVRRQMVMRDGVDHIRLRRQASPGFSPQALDAYRPAIRRIMGELLDRVQPLGQMDLVKEISYQLPPLVIAEILGIPAGDRDRFQKWAAPQAEFSNPGPGANMVELGRRASRAVKELGDYLGEVIHERRKHPGQDILSKMIHAQEMGQMSHEDLVAQSILILTAGHLTTTDQISNGIYDLLTHPDQLHKLQEDRTLLSSAVEEMMRFTPAVPFGFRVAASDIPLRGRTIRKGDTLYLGLASANRDPSVFADPDRFDISRDYTQHKHMSFGFGSHHCLGAGLARRELEIVTEMLLERLPGLRLDETQQPQPKLSLIFHGFNSLPLRW